MNELDILVRRISSNTIKYNLVAGINLSDSSDNLIYNNLFMNFKTNIGKTITSIIGGIVLGHITESMFLRSQRLCEPGFPCIEPTINYMVMIFSMLIFIGLIYIVWSLIEKK